MPRSRVLTVAEQVAECLTRSILDGTYRPGARLPAENSLAEEYGVSRSTVRQALDLLHSQGVVTVKRGRNGGYFLFSHLTDDCGSRLAGCLFTALGAARISLGELYETRTIIQVHSCGLAAERRQAKDLEAIKGCIPTDPALSTAEFLNKVIEFQAVIVAAAYNRLLSLHIASIVRIIRAIALTLEISPEDRLCYIANMTRIYEAIEKGDAEGARSCMRTCLDETHVIERYLLERGKQLITEIKG